VLKGALREVRRAVTRVHATRKTRACLLLGARMLLRLRSGVRPTGKRMQPRASCDHWPRLLQGQRRRAA